MEIINDNKTLLTVKEIFKTFRENKSNSIEVLNGISFGLQRGEFISLVGPSGCGKSTILRIISGLEKADSGGIAFEKPQGKMLNVGFIFQNYNVFPWLTVQQNISFGLFREKDDPKRKAKVLEWLKYTGLTEFADSHPKKLSGGMQQRLAIARTMVTEPDLLLMDEPFGALDIKTREVMQQLLLKAANKTGCSVLFVTHDLHEAIFLSDRIFLMSARPGKIVKEFLPSTDKVSVKDVLKRAENLNIYNEIVSIL